MLHQQRFMSVLPSEGWASPAPPPWSLHLTLWRSHPPSRCKGLYARSRCCSSDRWLDEDGDRRWNKSWTLWRVFPLGWLALSASQLICGQSYYLVINTVFLCGFNGLFNSLLATQTEPVFSPPQCSDIVFNVFVQQDTYSTVQRSCHLWWSPSRTQHSPS